MVSAGKQKTVKNHAGVHLISKSTSIVAMLLPVIFILIQLACAHHFHCANSFHDEQDVRHASCADISVKSADTLSDNLLIATLCDSSISSPLVLEGELARVDFPVRSPEVFILFSHCRAPPVWPFPFCYFHFRVKPKSILGLNREAFSVLYQMHELICLSSRCDFIN